MAVTSIVTCLLVTYVFATPVRSQEWGGREHPTADTFRDTIAANDKIALKLFQALSQTKRSANLIFSPASINLATAILAEGAKGRTADQLRKFLELQKDSREFGYQKLSALLRSPSKNNKIKSANALFVSRGLPLDAVYMEKISNTFKSDVANVEFNDPEKAAKYINDWVSQVTENAIRQLVAPHALSHNTRMVISNAVYFKGKWENSFSPAFTKREMFMNEGGGQEEANMMRIQGYYPYKKVNSLECAILEIPYADREYVMNIILPNGVVNMAQFAEKLFSSYPLAELLSPGKTVEVEVTLPRFNIETEQSLNGIFKQMGVTDVFGGQADLSGITSQSDGLWVSEFFHKAVIQVSEEGTVAAAATGVYIIPLTGFLTPEKFRADHPFIYCIRHQATGFLIFMGQVVNPGLVGPPVQQARRNKPFNPQSRHTGVKPDVTIQEPWRSDNITGGRPGSAFDMDLPKEVIR